MADKKYSLKFKMSDGNVKEVEFTVPEGPNGKSAYEYAKEGGYTGTEEEFAQKLASEGGGATPDWNAAEGEPGHVLNRTHWVDVQKNKVFLDTTVSASEIANNMAMIALDGELQAGQTYTVTFAGQQYSCECKYGMVMDCLCLCLGNPYAYGGEYNEEPFAILRMPATNMTALIPFVQANEYPIKIEGDVKIYHTIPSKFLPKPCWMIYCDLDATEVNVTQIDLNRAIDSGEMVAIRGIRPYNGTILMSYFAGRDQDKVITFGSVGEDSFSLKLIPNTSGGYDVEMV